MSNSIPKKPHTFCRGQHVKCTTTGECGVVAKVVWDKVYVDLGGEHIVYWYSRFVELMEDDKTNAANVPVEKDV